MAKIARQQTTAFRQVSEWFEALEQAERQKILDLMNKSYDDQLIDVIRQDYAHVENVLGLITEQIHEEMRKKTPKEMQALLQRRGMNAQLAQAMTVAANSRLTFYYLATALREMIAEEFKRVVELILLDEYVERRFVSWEYCDKYMKLGDIEKTQKCYETVKALVELHYAGLDSLEELGSLMAEELRFESKQIEFFLELILKYRAPLDRYMLLRRLSRLEKLLIDVSKK